MQFRTIEYLRAALLLAVVAILVSFACSDRSEPTGKGGPDSTPDSLVADHLVLGSFDDIDSQAKTMVRDSLRIFYGHTSHGSQLITGLDLVESADASFQRPTIHELGDDLGADGDTSWVAPTRAWLNENPEYNVVIWSWCGGVSSNSEEGINIYLSAMSDLEADYPNVAFVYMTGHLDGTGPDGNLYIRNNQIRAFCEANDKLLFDFADIESYDPAGVYYPNASDACEWAAAWCASNECVSCGCAHSECINCLQKGKAFWWLLAKLVS